MSDGLKVGTVTDLSRGVDRGGGGGDSEGGGVGMRSQGLALSQVSVLSVSAGRRVTASLTCKRQAAILTLPVIRTSQVSTRVLAAAVASVVASATLSGVLTALGWPIST